MRNIYSIVILFITFLIVQGCRHTEPDILLINRSPSEIILDGDIGEMAWNNATTVTGFISPWKPATQDSTIFRCFCSPDHFNFCFEVVDRSLTIWTIQMK